MPEPIEWDITEEQLFNYPSYRWPLKCSWCGFHNCTQVPEINGITFLCQMCGKPNSVERTGTHIRVSPGMRFSTGGQIAAGIIITILTWKLLH